MSQHERVINLGDPKRSAIRLAHEGVEFGKVTEELLPPRVEQILAVAQNVISKASPDLARAVNQTDVRFLPSDDLHRLRIMESRDTNLYLDALLAFGVTNTTMTERKSHLATEYLGRKTNYLTDVYLGFLEAPIEYDVDKLRQSCIAIDLAYYYIKGTVGLSPEPRQAPFVLDQGTEDTVQDRLARDFSYIESQIANPADKEQVRKAKNLLLEKIAAGNPSLYFYGAMAILGVEDRGRVKEAGVVKRKEHEDIIGYITRPLLQEAENELARTAGEWFIPPAQWDAFMKRYKGFSSSVSIVEVYQQSTSFYGQITNMLTTKSRDAERYMRSRKLHKASRVEIINQYVTSTLAATLPEFANQCDTESDRFADAMVATYFPESP